MGKEFDGITVDGKSIESYLLDSGDEEIGEVIKQERIVHRKKGKVRYMERKEPNGQVKTKSQAELNRLNLQSNIRKAKTRVERTLPYLLAGQTLTSKQIAEIMQIRASDAASMLRSLYKSNLGYYIVREGDASKGYTFHMTEKGLYLTPHHALEIYKSKKPEEIKPGPIEVKPEPPEPVELVRAPLDINLNISGGIQITFALKLEK